MKALVGAFNQEKALVEVGAFSVIIQPVVEPMDRFAALTTTQLLLARCRAAQAHTRARAGLDNAKQIMVDTTAGSFQWHQCKGSMHKCEN